jgi:4-hydroxythreonine-4-phosphate dehydrogenase
MMKKAENIIVGISIGRFKRYWKRSKKTFEDSRMLELCTPVIFANVKIMSFIKKEFRVDGCLAWN